MPMPRHLPGRWQPIDVRVARLRSRGLDAEVGLLRRRAAVRAGRRQGSRGTRRVRAAVAQGRLIRAVVGAGVLAAGAAAPAATPVLTATDYLVGALLGCGGASLLDRAPVAARLGLLTAIAWFFGTLAGAESETVAAIGSVCLLAYRGPLLHLLLIVPS